VTKRDWARLLDSLRDDDGARRDALLMLSDEDWVREEDRGWLRGAALRRAVLRPATDTVKGHKHAGHSYWVCGHKNLGAGEAASAVPRSVVVRMGEVDCKDLPAAGGGYTAYRQESVSCWVQLLEAIS